MLSITNALLPSSPLRSMGVQEAFLFPAREWETRINETQVHVAEWVSPTHLLPFLRNLSSPAR